MALPVPVNVEQDFWRFFASYEPQHARSTTLPVDNPTRSFWLHSAPDANPLATEGSSGALTGTADVAIIGAGITGVAAAYHLAKAFQTAGEKRKIVVVEARDFCSGATGRNGGHLTSHDFFSFASNTPAKRGLAECALEQHTIDSVAALVEAHNWAHEIDLVEGGRLVLFFSSEEEVDARRRFDSAKAAGYDTTTVQWLSRAEMNKIYGIDYPAVRLPARNVWPLKFVTRLFKLAQTLAPDLTLHTHTPVTSISRVGPSWQLHTARGNVRATYILHATNGYASHLLPHLSGANGIVPVRGHVIATRASSPLVGRESFTGNDGFEYWFPRPTKSGAESPLVILGGAREVAHNWDVGVIDDAHIDSKVMDVLRRFLPSVCPRSFERGRKPEMEWTGIMGFTKSGDPLVGPVRDNRVSGRSQFGGQYVCAGYTGHGMTRAFSCAEAVAGLIVADIHGAEWTPPPWFPSEYLTWNRI